MASNLALILANMFLPKQELPIQITNLNIIIIRTHNLPPFFGAKAHEPEHLDKLTPECPGPNQEYATFGGPGHKGITEEDIVIRVTGIEIGEGGLGGGEDGVVRPEELGEGVVEPLPEGAVLAVEFYYLLGDDAAPERTDWGYLGLTEFGNTVN